MSNIYIKEPPTSGKVLLHTTVGDIEIELWSKETPKTCRNFVQLCMEGYYNGTIFHRVVKNFIAQGGDPLGTGEGGESIYGHPFKDEFHTRLRFCRRGLVGMANAGKDDNGSQFFFTFGPCDELNNKNTIFGKVVGDTLFNMLKLEDGVIEKNDRPAYPNKIIKAEVLQNPLDDIVPRVKSYADSGIIENLVEKEKKRNAGRTKDYKLLSFGDEAMDDEEEAGHFEQKQKQKATAKGKSSHDLTHDPKLSTETVDLVEEMDSKGDLFSQHRISAGDVQEKLKMKKDAAKRTAGVQRSNDANDDNNITDMKQPDAADNDSDWLWKERDLANKKKLDEVSEEIRQLKRNMHLQAKKKQTSEEEEEQQDTPTTASAAAVKKPLKESKHTDPELKKALADFNEQHVKYAGLKSQLPKDASERERQTLEMLKRFKETISSSKTSNPQTEEETGNRTTTTRHRSWLTEVDEEVEDEGGGIGDSDGQHAEEGTSSDDDQKGWKNHTLKFEDSVVAPVLAKDANTKGDDWFDITDPRNAIAKRRREQQDGTREHHSGKESRHHDHHHHSSKRPRR